MCSLSAFCKFRPKNVFLLSDTPEDTCKCQTHENLFLSHFVPMFPLILMFSCILQHFYTPENVRKPLTFSGGIEMLQYTGKIIGNIDTKCVKVKCHGFQL